MGIIHNCKSLFLLIKWLIYGVFFRSSFIQRLITTNTKIITNTMIISTNTLPTLAPTMTGILGDPSGGGLVPLTERDQNSYR